MILAKNDSEDFFNEEAIAYFRNDGYIRNGDLTKIKNKILGIPNAEYKEPFRYGTLLDIYLTERERFIKTLTFHNESEKFSIHTGTEVLYFTTTEYVNILQNAEALLSQYPELSASSGTFQKVVKSENLAIDEQLFVKAKIKIDKYFEKGEHPKYPELTVQIDIKTTSAKSYEEYIKRFYELDYHRNGAFYKDVAKSNMNVLIAVNRESKIFPIYIAKDILEEGRKAYKTIIKQGVKAGLIVPNPSY